MILLFLTSGLFLGWSLGANDASNAFGSAVGSRMVSFRKAAIIASIAVIFGAVLQGSGGSQTLGKLGSINALGGSFTVALASAVTVYMMTKFALSVSTTQAIVGAIIGWNLFTGNNTDTKTLEQILITWVSGPVLGAVFAIILFIVLIKIKRSASIHLIRFESWMRSGLIIAGAMAAYGLGANNIANVMGVFVPAFNLTDLDLGIFSLNSAQQLFLIGGIAIASGILTYSKKVMQTIGGNIMELSSEAALVVVLAQSLVLFIFSSSALSDFLVKTGLPPIPLVPVSSSQVVVGCILGLGLYKGVNNINFKILRDIGLGWIATPIASGLLAFFSLFFMKNIFGINVGSKAGEGAGPDIQITNPAIYGGADLSGIFKYLLLGLLIFGTVGISYYLLLERKKRRETQRSEAIFWKNIK